MSDEPKLTTEKQPEATTAPKKPTLAERRAAARGKYSATDAQRFREEVARQVREAEDALRQHQPAGRAIAAAEHAVKRLAAIDPVAAAAAKLTIPKPPATEKKPRPYWGGTNAKKKAQQA